MSRDRVGILAVGDDPAIRTSLEHVARRRGYLVVRRSRRVRSAPSRSPARSSLLRPLPGTSEVGPGPVREIAVGSVKQLGELERALRSGDRVAIRWVGDRVIPLENLVAARPAGAEVWVITADPREVPGALGALEKGADRVILEVEKHGDLDELELLLDAPPNDHIAPRYVRVTSVRSAGMGDRVAVDTTSLLHADEGLLVGSSAACLFLVLSEATGSRYTRPRRFRVNAGAAHSYVLMTDGSTQYLSELSPGDAVQVVRPRGLSRSVRVGRLKIERRPMVLIEVEHGGHRRTVILQEAETVRLLTKSGPKSTTELSADARVFIVELPPARHMGRVVEETIEER